MSVSKVVNWCLLAIGCAALLNFIPVHFILEGKLSPGWLVFAVVSTGVVDFVSGCMIGLAGGIVLFSFAAEDRFAAGLATITGKMRPGQFLAIGAFAIAANSLLINAAEEPQGKSIVLIANSLALLACGFTFVAQLMVCRYLTNTSCHGPKQA